MRILLLSAKWLGDAVNTTGAVAAIQDAHPGAEIVVSVGAPGAGVFQGWPGIEVWERPKRFGLREQVAHFSRIRAKGFDLAVHLEASRSLTRWVRQAGVPKRVGVAKTDHGHGLHAATLPRDDEHEVRGPILRILDLLGLPPHEPDLRLTEVELRAGQERRAQLDERPVIALHLGASNTRKQWDLGEAAHLIRHLDSLEKQSVLIGGPNDTTLIPDAPCTAWAGTMQVREMAAFLACADGFVGNDSGPMHIAGALGLPTVGLFGPTNPARYGPPGHRSVTLRRCDCPFAAQDSNDDCDGRCTRAIPWRDVADALRTVLQR